MRRLLPLAVAFAAVAGPLAAQSTDAAAPEAPEIVTPADLTPEQFVASAAVSNSFEIASSQIVVDAPNAREDVKEFGRMMIEEHTAMGPRLAAAAEAAGAAPPPAEPMLDERHQNMVQALTDAEMETLDNAYLEMQLNSHIESVALFTAYSERDDALGEFAGEALPSLAEPRADGARPDRRTSRSIRRPGGVQIWTPPNLLISL
jgi:putative membrane protein